MKFYKNQQINKVNKIQNDENGIIIEQEGEITENIQKEQSQEEKNEQKIQDMMKMLNKIEQKYKSIENDYVKDRETARIDVQIQKKVDKMEQLQTELENTILTEKQKLETSDINEVKCQQQYQLCLVKFNTQDYQSGKDALLLNVLSQLKVVTAQNEKQQKIIQQQESKQILEKDEKIQKLEQMLKQLQSEKDNYVKEIDQLRFQSSQNNYKDEQYEDKQKMNTKVSTEGNQKDIWLPQNELQSNDFSYFSSSSANKIKLKPINKSTIPHFDYIPPAKINILKSSLNKELNKVASTNQDGTHRQNTPMTQSSEKYKQIINTPMSEPNKYRIKKYQQPQIQNQRNIFISQISSEQILNSRNGSFLQNNAPTKKPHFQDHKDMNDYFFEKPSSVKNKQY